MCEFFVGDAITSIHKTSLVTGGREVLVYTCLLGTMGMMVPFVNHEDVEFFQLLEMHMRQALPPLLGRDHLAYRSYYMPVKNVVDGDICDLFCTLPYEKRLEIAQQMDKSVGEISKKLEDVRTRVAF